MSSEVEGEQWPVQAGESNIVSKIQDFAVALISDIVTYTVHLPELLANPAGKTRSASH